MQTDNNMLKFHALTMINTVTNLTEIVRVRNTTAQAAATAFEVGWLCRYPRPVRVIHDQGTKFMGENFQAILWQLGIRNAPIGVRNPQANAICEGMHQQVLGNIFRTILHSNHPPNADAANALIDYALQTVVHAMKATTHRTLGVSPGALVFHRA